MNTKQVSVQSKETGFGALQAGIVLLTLATAIIHLTLLFPDVIYLEWAGLSCLAGPGIFYPSHSRVRTAT